MLPSFPFTPKVSLIFVSTIEFNKLCFSIYLIAKSYSFNSFCLLNSLEKSLLVNKSKIYLLTIISLSLRLSS